MKKGVGLKMIGSVVAVATMTLAASSSPAAQGASCCLGAQRPARILDKSAFMVSLPTLAGDTYDLTQVAGKAPLILLRLQGDSTTDEAARTFEAVKAETPDSTIAWLAAMSDTSAAARAHVAGLGLSYPVLLDASCQLASLCSTGDCPSLVMFLDDSGNVVMNTSDAVRSTLAQGIAAVSPNAQVTDPVCKMQLTRGEAAASYSYKGKTYYFCSQACHDKFVRDPERYLKN